MKKNILFLIILTLTISACNEITESGNLVNVSDRTEFTGELIITGSNFTAYSGIKKVTGDLIFRAINPGSDVRFEYLEEVTGNIVITNNDAVNIYLPALVSVINLNIDGNNLGSFNFPELLSSKDIYIYSNSGQFDFNKLATINGDLSVLYCTGPINYFPALTAITGSLAFANNTFLTEISLPLLTSVNVNLAITDNNGITDASVNTAISGITVGGTTTVWANTM